MLSPCAIAKAWPCPAWRMLAAVLRTRAMRQRARPGHQPRATPVAASTRICSRTMWPKSVADRTARRPSSQSPNVRGPTKSAVMAASQAHNPPTAKTRPSQVQRRKARSTGAVTSDVACAKARRTTTSSSPSVPDTKSRKATANPRTSPGPHGVQRSALDRSCQFIFVSGIDGPRVRSGERLRPPQFAHRSRRPSAAGSFWQPVTVLSDR